MAISTQVSVGEYLAMAFHPDCDYVDGEILERTLGEQTHSLIQAAITRIFGMNRRVWGLRVLPEQRVQVSAVRFRIPDVCVVSAAEPIRPILQSPPLLCVEILSPEDRFNRVQERVSEYLAMGVPHVWIIDPETRAAWIASRERGVEPLDGNTLTLPGTAACMTIAEIFEEIDEAPKL